MAVVKQFTIGKDKFPTWFNDEAAKGRAKVEYDDGEIVSVTVYAPTGKFLAKPGDVIMMMKTGMTVVPDKKAVKYGVKPEAKQEAEKEKADVQE